MRLGARQWEMLDRICRSNGGGVFVGFFEGDPEAKTILRLHELGLVQGKSGDLSCAVHTRKGLDLWREQKETTP